MKPKFSTSFKIKAVEKALSRSDQTTLKEISGSLGVGDSTLQKWIVKARNHEYEPVPGTEFKSVEAMSQEKRPQDWSPEEKMTLISLCGVLGDDEVSRLCRERGLYPHHIKQWKQDFIGGVLTNQPSRASSETKDLRLENSALKKELNRKDKALAETAALLVLQKKVHAWWASDEGNSQ